MGRQFAEAMLAKLGRYAVLVFTLAATAVLLGHRHASVEQLPSLWAVVLEAERLAEGLAGPWALPVASLVSTMLHLLPGYLPLTQYLGVADPVLVQQHPVIFLMTVFIGIDVVTALIGLLLRSTRRRPASAPADERSKTAADDGAAALRTTAQAVPGQACRRRARLQRMNPWR